MQHIAIMEAQQGLCMLQAHFGLGADSGERKRGTSDEEEQFSRKKTRPEPEVKYKYHPKGTPKSITYYRNNLKHREDGPAYVEYLEDGKTLKSEKYFINGNLHRDSGAPAWISYWDPSKITVPVRGNIPPKRVERYYWHGLRQRSKGPAFIEYGKNGKKKKESYYRDDVRHRSDGPAIINYYYIQGDSKAHIKTASYYFEGNQAYIKNDSSGTLDEVYDMQKRLLFKVHYDRSNLISRDDGPAVIRYDKDGNVEYEGYWYRGTQFDNEEDYYDRIHFQLMDVPVPYRYVDETAKSMYDAQKLGIADLFEVNETKSLDYWKQYVKDQLLEQKRDKAEKEVAGRLVYRYGTTVFAKKAPK